MKIPKNIKELKAYTSARSVLKGEGWQFMDANESPFTFVQKTIPQFEINKYPDPTSDKLRKCAASIYKITPDQVVFANGSDELVDLVIKGFVRPARSILLATPTYGMYKVQSQINNRPVIEVKTDKEFRIRYEAMKENFNKADLIILCSPNNPTGKIVPIKVIKKIANNFRGLIVVDEAYGEFAEIKKNFSAISLVRQGYKNILVLRTLSKAYGGAGLRLGYAVGSPEVVEIINKIKPPYNVSSLSQQIGLKLLQNRNVMKRNVKKIIASKKWLRKSLVALKCEVVESQANFLLFRLPILFEAKKVYEIFKNEFKVVVRYFDSPDLSKYLRVSVGNKKQNRCFISCLKEIFERNRVVFLDRDGTLIYEPPKTKQVDSMKDFRVLPGVVQGLKKLKQTGYRLVMVSNQDGLGTKSFPKKNFNSPQKALLKTLRKSGIIFEEIFISPDFPRKGSLTRKPATGLVEKYIKLNKADLPNSIVIGDRESDKLFAKNLGTKFVKVKTNGEFPII